MPESLVQVTSGAGPKLHTWQYTVGANNVEQEFGLPGEYPYPTYSVVATNVSVATTADHLLQLMAGASLRVRLRRIWISQLTIVTTAAQLYLEVLRLTTAGTGGGVVTPRPFDTNDAAAGFTAMTLPTAKGTEVIVDGLRIIGTAKNKTSVISFVVNGLNALDIGIMLDTKGIAVRTGHHCTEPLMDRMGIPGTVRASFAVYNTKEEIDYFIEALKKTIKILK